MTLEAGPAGTATLGAASVRARWHPLVRVLLYLGVLILVSLFLSLVFLASLTALGDVGMTKLTQGWGALWALGGTLLMSFGMLAVTALFLRHMDRASWKSLVWGARRWRDFALGYGFALLLLLILFLVMWIAGWVQIDGAGEGARRGAAQVVFYLVALAVAFLIQGGTEEVVCRGYLFRNFYAWHGLLPALLGSSLLFGIAHMINPGASWRSLVDVVMIGILLGLLAVRVSLTAAVAMHGAWNFALGALLALPVSGIRIPGILDTRLTGPEGWTGGEFGPEASPITTLLTAIGCIGLLVAPGFRTALERYRAASGLAAPALAAAHPDGHPGDRDRADAAEDRGQRPIAYNYIRIPPPGGDPAVGPPRSTGGGESPGSEPDPPDST